MKTKTTCFTWLILFLIGLTNLHGQVLLKTTDSTLSTTIDPRFTPYYKNFEMAGLYKELQHFSKFAPFGEIFSGRKYLFTADVNPIYIFSNSVVTRWNVGVGIRVLARMFTDSSYPIRTPSYIPTIKIFYRVDADMDEYKFVDFSASHHSNGQDGPSRVNGDWNERNGNFSTNWLTLGYNWGHNVGNRRKHTSVYLQRHFEIGKALTQDSELKGYYGQTRGGIDFQARSITNVSLVDKGTDQEYYAYRKEQFRLHGYVNYIFNGLNRYLGKTLNRRINTEINFHWFPLSFREGGFFAGLGYYGEDPYNIYFHDKYFLVKFGFSAGMPLFLHNSPVTP
ncbi:hypothetical protein EXU57_23275 [Segetibacter sp. 3557_3]|uniref:hypothetical protein n=1 Tax=Segetibacter sp. 3557_3 TaxID=2547429 RepID=UPI00105857C6|nr:hypothetical protein [Segetibacter sp. 3557_3]TDH18388.1 hypothetical protein EXU57_23275 [Segetibacter sp. 3557_3]